MARDPPIAQPIKRAEMSCALAGTMTARMNVNSTAFLPTAEARPARRNADRWGAERRRSVTHVVFQAGRRALSTSVGGGGTAYPDLVRMGGTEPRCAGRHEHGYAACCARRRRRSLARGP